MAERQSSAEFSVDIALRHRREEWDAGPGAPAVDDWYITRGAAPLVSLHGGEVEISLVSPVSCDHLETPPRALRRESSE